MTTDGSIYVSRNFRSANGYLRDISATLRGQQSKRLLSDE